MTFFQVNVIMGKILIQTYFKSRQVPFGSNNFTYSSLSCLLFKLKTAVFSQFSVQQKLPSYPPIRIAVYCPEQSHKSLTNQLLF